jgi:CheY-like chemotaxis protein
MKSVLLADDSPFILETLAARLRDDGNEVITATNGQEAVDQGRRLHPDLAILDVSMPVMNGLEAAECLHKIMPHLPIILFTSYAEALKSRVNQSGVIAIFDKSSRLCDLISAVDECFQRKQKLG